MNNDVTLARPSRPKSTAAKLRSIWKRARYTIKAANRRKYDESAGKYAKYCNALKIDDRLVCYEAYYGAGMICNPNAIYQELIRDSRFGHLRHVWIIANPEELERLKQEHASTTNVEFILRDSDEYYRTLATAKYIVENVTLPAFFAKRPGQIYINTWHSITVKTLGYDQPDGNYQSRNMMRNLLMSDYICSANRFMTDIFRNSFKLQGLYPGKVIQAGHPRNDLTIRASREQVIQKLRARSIHVDPAKKIILYAPTWRGTTVGSVLTPGDEFREFRQQLSQLIDMSQYQILVKPHHFSFRAMSKEEQESGDYIPREVDTNELLGAVDILISDYSSIYFDFMVTDRPILFYLPDLVHYEQERGIYFSPDELPGPYTDSVIDIGIWVNKIEGVQEEYRQRYDTTKAWACEFDDGCATGRLVDVVFGKKDAPFALSDFTDPAKKRILFYVSELGPNGVTSAFFTLLRRLERESYDITVCGFQSKTEVSQANWARIGADGSPTRALIHYGSFTLTRWEQLGIEYTRRYGLNGPLYHRVLRPQKALRREFVRWFGDSHFDYIIDFSGYGAIWPAVLGQDPGASKLIWQHNDLAADLSNANKRRLRKYRTNPVSATGLKSIYARYDKIVSCGEEIMWINRRNIHSPTFDHKYTYANNLIDADRVRELSKIELPTDAGGKWVAADERRSASGMRVISYIPDEPPFPDSSDPYLKFVTIGRLAPEKNHAALIEAFAEFSHEHPNSRLYIIGQGGLASSLSRLAARLGVGETVTLTGNLNNPFAIVKNCDCFVLPSLYEGNVLVIPEVRMLGIPIIMSDFGSSGSVCIPNGQLVTGTSAKELHAGLQSFAAGLVPTSYKFDIDARNEQAFLQFLRLLSPDTPPDAGPGDVTSSTQLGRGWTPAEEEYAQDLP